MSVSEQDPNRAYRETQSQIYRLQETLLNSARTKNVQEEVKKESSSSSLSGQYEFQKGRTSVSDVPEVNSQSVLAFTEEHYPKKPKNLGTLYYNRFKEGSFREDSASYSDRHRFPYNLYDGTLPLPFLPAIGVQNVNNKITVNITYEDIQASFENLESPRARNNEIWGCDIYSDDSDPILALRHCGFKSVAPPAGLFPKLRRTPANMANQDNVTGNLPLLKGTPFDLEVELLLLPTLQRYPSVKRFDITSREWGSEDTVLHDGLSYGIYGIVINQRLNSDKSHEPNGYIKNLKWT
ncbi:rxt3p [Saccharomyces arboricola H-6]|uniref:Rxt3p n=1 Tax=Saccharomyces arboricola (strain H-6 / AS 2.3317 / CBS 10644) TaxID=1160507 RepID=J8Q9V4_SACAR|nr:rxt3p [Saccharomyces arboricola H-6]